MVVVLLVRLLLCLLSMSRIHVVEYELFEDRVLLFCVAELLGCEGGHQ